MSLNVCQLTVLTSVSMGLGPASCLQKKFRLTATGEVVKTNFQMPSLYRVELRDVKNIHELRATIEDAAREPRKAVIRGLPTTTQSVCRKDGQHFSEHPEGTPWVMLDFDDLDLPPDIDPITADAVEWAISKLPEEFRNVTYLFQHSSSAGILQRGVPIKKGLNAHVFFWLSKRVPGGLLDAHLQQHCLQTGFYQIYETANGATRIRYGYDRALFQEVQAHYIAPPDIGDGVECRLVPSARQDLVRKASDEVVVPVFAADLVRTAGSEHRRVVHDHQRANGYVRHVTQTRVGSGTATSAYYVNPKRTSQGDREFVRAELKKNGELAVLYFKDESSPGSCVVMKGHKPHMAYKPGSERMLLKELSIGAHNYVRDALKWFNEVPGHTLQLTEQGYLPPLDSFAHAKVSLVLAPTGSGKTKAVVNWIRQSKKDVPICVYSAPTIALVNQTQQDLREAGILVHYYRSLGGTPSTGVIVTTNKSLPAILRILSTNATPHALIVDEIHVGLDEFLKRQKTSERFEQALSCGRRSQPA